MTYHNLFLHSEAHSDVAETHTPIDALIRPGLRQAFPLPVTGQAADEQFTVLLWALAPRSGGTRQAAISLTVLAS
jgi:hypothetical protein